MILKRPFCFAVVIIALCCGATAWAQQVGSISGTVYDKDFGAPLGVVEVQLIEAEQQVKGNDEGGFRFGEVPPGTYTLVFTKEGYTRQVKANVVVTEGEITEVNIELAGDFEDMPEFVVQDIQIGGATEAGLIELRVESPQLMDSIGSDLMSRAGVGDAAGALRLVAGATVRDNKAVIRGLPDRYVSSQLNGVRLPSADAETRAVELDQFPSDVIESIQVSKTFTPDQQGDASGGAVNVVTKSIPDQDFIFEIGVGTSINTQVLGRDDFLNYKDGGISFLGDDKDRKDSINTPNDLSGLGLGVEEQNAPFNFSLDGTIGGRHTFDNDVTVGGLASLFYGRSSSFHDNGIDDKLESDGTDPSISNNPLTPVINERGSNFISNLFDITKGELEEQWGGLFTGGIEIEGHSLSVMYLLTHTTTDTAILAEDTRSKTYFFPGHDPDDPTTPGHGGDATIAPYVRNETISYVERKTESLQFSGDHTLPFPEFGIEGLVTILPPEIGWTLSQSTAIEDEPDKRQFGEVWYPETAGSFEDRFPFGNTINNPGPEDRVNPPEPAVHVPLRPGSSITFGNLQRIYQKIEEESDQLSLALKIPFEQWTGDKGFVKVGLFTDDVGRTYEQQTFTNLNQPVSSGSWEGPWEESLSDAVERGELFLFPVAASDQDINYSGDYEISAWYWMLDLPVTSWARLIGGIRYEKTDINIIAAPELRALVVLPETGASVQAFDLTTLERNISPTTGLPLGDAKFQQEDMLPSIGFSLTPLEGLSFRGSYTETIARQTFRELSPVVQQEFLGGDIFVGNPNLQAGAVKNYDLRIDYRPTTGTLLSASWFRKDITQAIEFVQRFSTEIGTFATAVNFPEGTLEGFEFEVRQSLGDLWDPLEGLSIGFNATLIDSVVKLSPEETALIGGTGVNVTQRNMANAPERLFNFNLMYDLERTGTQFGLFYTIQGDTLLVGHGTSTNGFVPPIFAKEYETLNFTVSQKLGENFKLSFKAKNLTNPEIQQIYRSAYTQDTVHKSYTKGIDLSLSISAKFEF